jgi:hypothetical protein
MKLEAITGGCQQVLRKTEVAGNAANLLGWVKLSRQRPVRLREL